MKDLLKDTRAILAYFWSFVAAILLMYIIVRFGDKVEILTLIIGLIGGTILGGVFGTYFSANNNKHSANINTTIATETNTTTLETT